MIAQWAKWSLRLHSISNFEDIKNRLFCECFSNCVSFEAYCHKLDAFTRNWNIRRTRCYINASPLDRVSTYQTLSSTLRTDMSFRYAFPLEPILDGDTIDLTVDEKLFYFNPYSGEFSLDFPKAERNCFGGILA